MEDADEFDEFLFHSITRYNILQMFNLENVPCNILQLDDFCICVSSQRANRCNSELLRLHLPKKLILPPEEEGRSKENDFKVLTGAYTQGLVYDIGKLAHENKVITSEFGVRGLKIYDLSSKSLGLSKQEESFDSIPWLNPNFIVLKNRNNIVCTKSSQDGLLLVDIEAKKLIKEFKQQLPFQSGKTGQTDMVDDKLKCESLNNDLIAVLNTVTGDLYLHDLRTSDCFTNLPRINKTFDDEVWSISRHDSSNSLHKLLGVVSNRQNFSLYDIAKTSVLIEATGGNLQKVEGNNMKFKFCENETMFSLSGFGSDMTIYRINCNGFEHVFTHDGHSPSNLPSDIVTDHLWLPIGNKELIISISNNKTLNCWEFNARSK